MADPPPTRLAPVNRSPDDQDTLLDECLKLVIKVVRDTECPRCKLAAESVDHALWWCVKSKEDWVSTPYYRLISRFKGLGSGEVLRELAIGLKHAALEAVGMVLWSIWLDRNGIVHNGAARSAGILVDGILAFLKDFQASRKVFQPSLLAASPSVLWSPPQDDKGWVVADLSKPLTDSFSSKVGGAVGAERGSAVSPKFAAEDFLCEARC
ncbi:hypothetical protein QYF36_008852 [Acer negundo]|nr:hypothetical protein QYF36_008852 [Acer negundo]